MQTLNLAFDFRRSSRSYVNQFNQQNLINMETKMIKSYLYHLRGWYLGSEISLKNEELEDSHTH